MRIIDKLSSKFNHVKHKLGDKSVPGLGVKSDLGGPHGMQTSVVKKDSDAKRRVGDKYDSNVKIVSDDEKTFGDKSDLDDKYDPQHKRGLNGKHGQDFKHGYETKEGSEGSKHDHDIEYGRYDHHWPDDKDHGKKWGPKNGGKSGRGYKSVPSGTDGPQDKGGRGGKGHRGPGAHHNWGGKKSHIGYHDQTGPDDNGHWLRRRRNIN